ncbi:hypothetical protein KR093_005468 [Drosophila rubida]|uniref:Uncharacterized protein n=1 Tax=Drosophila rubida TaxID=30044 RepID=A0AAD4K0X7_9MUSC|nr:hypothetical protein KR093_005468 [Drosophila rubida]
MTSHSLNDLEEQLDNFIIRKNKGAEKTFVPPHKTAPSGQKIHDHIPLLVRDILKSSLLPDDAGVFTTHIPATLNYRTCLVYGFVSGRGVHNKSFHKYIVDDGSGSIEISINIKPKERKLITSLHNEAVALSTIADFKNIAQIMQRLLNQAMSYIDGSSIQPGSNILLFGRPNLFRGKWSLNVISFLVDNGRSRKLELVYADCLIQYYQSQKK